MDMEKHVTIIGVFHIGIGLMGLLAAAIVFLAVVGGGLISGDPTAIRITGVVGTTVAGFVGLLSLPWVVGGFGLLQHWSWARFLTLILAVVELTGVPIGTLLGIYTIWVLIHDETEKLFAGRAG